MDATIARAGREHEGKGGKEGKEVPSPAARAKKGKAAPAPDRVAILEGMKSVEPLVKDCYRDYKQKGCLCEGRLEDGAVSRGRLQLRLPGRRAVGAKSA